MVRGVFALSMGVSLLAISSAARADDDRKACDAAYDRAQILRDAKKLTEARDQLVLCARPMCAQSVIKDCTAWLAEAESRIPSVLVVATDPAGNVLSNVSLTIDGSGVSRPLDGSSWDIDPGQHTFAFAAADGTRAVRTVLVVEGQKAQRVAATLAVPATRIGPSPSPPLVAESELASARQRRRVVAIAIGGAGIASAVVGGIFGGLTLSEVSSANSACPSHVNCSSSATSDRSTAVTFSTVSDVGWIAGGALVATGVALWFTAPTGNAASASLRAFPGGLQLAGKF